MKQLKIIYETDITQHLKASKATVDGKVTDETNIMQHYKSSKATLDGKNYVWNIYYLALESNYNVQTCKGQ